MVKLSDLNTNEYHLIFKKCGSVRKNPRARSCGLKSDISALRCGLCLKFHIIRHIRNDLTF